MKPNKTQVVVAMAVLMTFCLGALAYGTPPSPPRPYDYKFEPVEVPKTAGPVTFIFEVERTEQCNRCDDIHITIETVGGVEYSGPKTHTIHPKMGERHSEAIIVNLLPNDTGNIFLFLNSKDPNQDTRKCWPIRRSFVTTGDTVEYFLGFPRITPIDPRKERAELLAKARTPEKLAKVYGVRFKLRDPAQRLQYERIVGELPDTHKRGFYYVETTWGNILQLADSGFNFEYIPPGEDPFPSLAPPTKTDSASDSVPKKSDQSAPQGSLSAPSSLPGLSIVNVDGEFGWGVISMNDSIRFHIRINNTSGTNVRGITNGFKLYGLDPGVQWTTPVGGFHSNFATEVFDQTFVSYFSANGSGADTIGFGGSRLFDIGLPSSFNDTAYSITIGPISSALNCLTYLGACGAPSKIS